MNLITFVRVIGKSLKWLIGVPLLVAITVIYLTRDMPKDYNTNTVIYTGIASGYDITSENSKVDYFAVNTAFDNLINIIKSRETVEMVSIQLLAQHLLLDNPELNILSGDGFLKLKEVVPDSLRKQLVEPGDFEATVARIYTYKKASVKNEIEELLASTNPFYGISKIKGKMSVKRINSSDLIEISFSSNDPGVAQNTLLFLANTFMKRYKGLKGIETSSVVGYFKTRLNNAFDQLQESEEKLKNFGINNRIINYQEQSKFIAEAKEDLESELYRVKMKNEAAKAAIGRLELQMSDLIAQLKNNDQLALKRKRLGDINILLSNAQAYKESINTIDSLNRESYLLQEEIRDIVEKYYDYSHSIEGIESNKVLDQWLKKIIEFEETQANLKVFEERKTEFDKIYDQYAPLGSTLSKLEREVGISEKQYLSVLHGLNMAQLRQQNLEMSNTLSILDQPFFPVKPQASKRGMLVMVSFIALFFMILTSVVIKEYLDDSIKTPSRAVEITGLPIAGALTNKNQKDKRVLKDHVENYLLEQAVSNINLELMKNGGFKDQYFAITYSIRPNEGKSLFMEKLVNKLTQVNGKVAYLRPLQKNQTQHHPHFSNNEKVSYHEYDVSPSFLETHDWKNLIDQTSHETINACKFIFVELPPVNRNPIPSDLVSKADFSLLLINANRVWRDADKHLNKMYLKATNGFTMVILNKVQIDFIENLLGEIPKTRSKVRRWIKKAILFNFRKH